MQKQGCSQPDLKNRFATAPLLPFQYYNGTKESEINIDI